MLHVFLDGVAQEYGEIMAEVSATPDPHEVVKALITYLS
jgi:hypothetical protein